MIRIIPILRALHPKWREGLHSGAGDVQLPLNVILLDRELRVAGGEKLNVGFEPQLVLTPLGLSPHDGGWHYQPAIAAGLDLLRWKVTEDLDWHIIQAWGFLQGDIPMAGKDGALLGGGFQRGTGVKLALPHSGPDEKVRRSAPTSRVRHCGRRTAIILTPSWDPCSSPGTSGTTN